MGEIVSVSVEWGRIVLSGDQGRSVFSAHLLKKDGIPFGQGYLSPGGAYVTRSVRDDITLNEVVSAMATLRKGGVSAKLIPGLAQDGGRKARMGRPPKKGAPTGRQRTLVTMEYEGIDFGDISHVATRAGWDIVFDPITLPSRGGVKTTLLMVEFDPPEVSDEWLVDPGSTVLSILPLPAVEPIE